MSTIFRRSGFDERQAAAPTSSTTKRINLGRNINCCNENGVFGGRNATDNRLLATGYYGCWVVDFYNRGRPHSSLGPGIPDPQGQKPLS
jgi:hypothetical protein